MEHSFNKVIDLLFLAKQDGVEVVLNEERLQIKIAESKEIDQDLLTQIRENKQLIIDYLTSDNWKATGVDNNHNKISKFNRATNTQIPLSFSQERLWFVDQLEGSVQYHSPSIMRLKGNLNIPALSNALNTVINRHDILRTIFTEENGRVFQSVKENSQWELQIEERTSFNEDGDALKCYIEQLVKAPFDLSRDYPVRGSLIRLNEQEYILVVTMHHIASDAWSVSIIVKEVVELYNSFVENREMILPPLSLQYADYAVWQRNYLQGEVLDKKVKYWEKKLEGVTPLQLPADYSRPSVRGSSGAAYNFRIDKALTNGLTDLSRQQGASLFMVLLSVYKVLLYRYSGQLDISVGTSIASRQQKELEELIGFFVNTLALRDELNPVAPFTDLLQQVKTTTLEAYEHQELPFEKVVEAVVTERDMSISPLFQVMLVLQNTPEASRLKLGEVELSGEPLTTNISKFDITFFINETPAGLQCKVEYSTDLYKAETIRGMAEHFEVLLDSVVKNPQQQVGWLTMLTRSEELQLLQEFNSSEVVYPKEKTIVDLFEEQVIAIPAATAVLFENESLSFLQLNERSNQLAHQLISIGITSDALVPLYIQRSASMLIGMMGIMKAGAAYVPIDTDFPPDRIRYMLEDTVAAVIVSDKASAGKLSFLPGTKVIEIDNDILYQQPVTNLSAKPSANQLAYVIYTSGSTGKPKGAMIAHRSLMDYYYGLNKHIQIDQCRSFALVSTIATDLGNTVIYASLLAGGALHVFSKESVSNIDYLHDYFTAHSIDCLKIVPSHWKALARPEELLIPKQLLIFGGEALQTELVELIHQSQRPVRIINHYGPTETTIGKLLHEVKHGNEYGKTIPIGKPFSNTKVYVLSKELQLCPVGVPGQLYIAGDGLAKGYFNNEQLTKEKFISDLFAAAQDRKMYGTGDLVKWLADGSIQFIGRVDDQVKIRGYRVELGEIESILQQSELVSQAVVLASDDRQGNKRLVAYIVPNDGFDKDGIISFLREKLPEYMVPSAWIALDALPLTANGKTDRKALPDPDSENSTMEAYTAPRNETERQLAAIWEEVLEVEKVGVHDDFFELGGHSLLAVRLVSAIRKAFTVEMPIGDIFDYPTVALLSTRVTTQPATTLLPAIQKVIPRPERIPLSFSQERLWFIDQLGGSGQYHLPAILRLKGALNKEALSNALNQIVSRHETLRTIILDKDGAPYQVIKNDTDWLLNEVDGKIYQDDPMGLQAYIKQFISNPYNLAADYMLRATLVSLNTDDHILVVTLHHIASDGWSTSIIVKELAELYNACLERRAASLPVLPIQYSDYAIWQRSYLQGQTLETKLDYWRKKLAGTVPLQLYTDYPRGPIQSNAGSILSFSVDKATSDQLAMLSQQQGSTLFMTLLSVLKIMLYRYSGQQDICIGTPVAGRQQQEVEGLIGFFINMLAIRSHVDGNVSFKELLKEVRATTMEAYAHQEVPFEKLVEATVKERDMSRSPLFQVLMVLQNTPDTGELKLGDVQLSRGMGEVIEHSTSKFELTFTLSETSQGLALTVEYNTDLYKENTIRRMASHFTELLKSVVQNPNEQVGRLSMVTGIEKRQLLDQFNNNKTTYPSDKPIARVFEERAKICPDNIAISFKEERLTYKELNERSNQLAYYLQKKGVKEGVLVPVFIERRIEMMIAILAILKVGAAYVPVDPAYPAERINFMFEDIAASLILTSKDSRNKIPFDHKDMDIVVIDMEWLEISMQSTSNLLTPDKVDSLAYVIYTSGSTGRPKGVMVTQKNVVSLVTGIDYVTLTSTDILLSTGSPSFDASTFEYWGMLLNGGCLVICTETELLDNTLLKEAIKSKGVNRMWFTSSWFNQLVEADITIFETLSTILVGGERLSEYHIYKLKQTYPAIEIINGYGPTENTTFSLTYNISGEGIGGAIPIGRPLSNRTAFILDANNQPVPIGVSGEICVGGDGLSRGYLNQPELTAEKFIKHPFITLPSEKIYKTGDIGRWLPDGNIEYLGRIDEQVKIRGYRVEPGEIEAVLQQSELVAQAAVVPIDDSMGNKSLVAYIVPYNKMDKEAIFDFLRQQIPEYMIPALIVELDQLPLTANGKVDRMALPDPEISQSFASQYEAPRNELEARLADIWEEVLDTSPVGIHDNFFDLGGHSLHAVKLVSIIRKRMEVDISINDVFIYPTIAGLIGNFIEKIKNPSLPEVNVKFLVPIRTTGNKVPLYIVAGGGGTALRFKKFASLLAPNQPVYVLQPPIDIKDIQEFPDTIEGIAGKFIEEILIQYPDGPFALSGHCLGGIIAFEMARQLEAAGKKIKLLAMFDTIIRKAPIRKPGTWQNLYHMPLAVHKTYSKLLLKVGFETFLLRKHTRQSIRYKMDTLQLLFKKIKSKRAYTGKIEFNGLELFDGSADVYVAATKNYKLMPYNGPLVAFYAKEHYLFLDKSKNVGYKKIFLNEMTKNMWNQYAQKVSIHEVEGEHSEIFDPANGDGFANLLQQHLDQQP